MAYTLVPTELIVDGAITSAKLDTNIAISGTLGVTGEVTLATHLVMGDNDKIKIGTGGDLEIYHDGSNSYISNSTGNLYLGDTNGSVHIQAKLNEESIVCASDGAVTLYHDNAVKLATSSAGVTVTGTLAATLSTAAQTNITSVGTLTGLDVAGTATMDGLTVQSTATTRPTIGNSDVNTSGLTTGLNFEPISNLTNGAKLNVISGLQPTVASAYTAGFEFVTEDHSGGGTFAQTKALTIGASGDISFYEDTGTTAKFFWDASAESLGIGTDNPSTALEVNNASAGATVATFEGTYNASGDVKLASFERSGGAVAAAITYADAATAMEFGTTTSHALILTTGDTERMRITSSGVIQSTNGTTTSEWYPSGGVQYFGTSTNHPIQFFTNNSNAMQIDTSGNLLVGTTSTSASVAGGRIFSTGRLVTSVNNEGHYFRRNSSDGTIVEFAKDSSTVGSIGNISSRIYIGSGDTGIFFDSIRNQIQPCNTTTGSNIDATIDLGRDVFRFKDLYLSGIANVGTYLRFGGAENYYIHSDNANYLRFGTAGDERIRITSTGNLEFKSTTTTFAGASSFTNHSNGVLYLRGGTSGLRLDDDDSHNTIHVSGAGNYISFETLNGTERWRFNSSGHFTPAQQHTYDIGGTNAEVRNIYAQGISFASNAHAGGMTSELLDDYEEGTWTPTLNSGSFSASTATYTKVGRVVTVTLDATVGTGGGSNITLPYACTNTTGTGIYVSNQNFATGRTQMCWVAASTKIYFRSIGDNVIYSGEALTAGATIHATITYNAT
jgi:hypothetical protein